MRISDIPTLSPVERGAMAAHAMSAPTNASAKQQAVHSYAWLALGFAISGLTAFALLRYGGSWVGMGNGAPAATAAGALQLIAMLWLVFKLDDMPEAQTKLWLLGYSVLSGVCLPILFLFFTQHILLSPFFLLAAMYGLSAGIGFSLNIDMSRAWTWGVLAVIGFALNVYLNLIWRDDRYQLIASGIAVLILLATTIYQFRQKPIGANASPSALKAALAININVFFLFVMLVLSANERRNSSRD